MRPVKVTPPTTEAARNGRDMFLVGATALTIALLVALTTSSPLARFLTGVLAGMAIVAVAGGVILAFGRSGAKSG